MSETKKQPTATQALKLEFDVYKQKILTKFGQSLSTFRAFVFQKEPSYNCFVGIARINNVWNGRSADITLNALIEEFATELENNLSTKTTEQC